MQHVTAAMLRQSMTMLSMCAIPASVQALSNQQLQEIRNEAAGLHVELANLKASQQQVQANQVKSTVAFQWHSWCTSM